MKFISLLLMTFWLCNTGYGKNIAKIHTDECSRGASYWCSSTEAAMHCQAVDYCQLFSWRTSSNEHLELQQPFHCMYITRQVKRLLSLNFTQKFIVEQAVRICDILPNPQRGACQAIARNYFVSVIELLHVGATTQQICYEAKIIRALKQSITPALPPPPISKNTTLCGYCKYFISILDAMLERKGEIQNLVQTVVDNACEGLADGSEKECIDFVRKYLPGIIKAIEKLPPTSVCYFLLDVCVDAQATDTTKLTNEMNALMPNKCELGPIYGCLSKHTSETCNMKQQCLPIINL